MGVVILKRGREKPLRRKHPWVFSGAIQRADAAPGDIVDVLDADGHFVARGYYNPASQIRVRLLTWDEHERVNADFWRRRLRSSLAHRDALLVPPQTNALRLIHAESDALPGLVVDRYGPWLVLQALTLGIERHKALIVELLAELVRPAGIYERSDEEVRRLEGLEPTTGPLWGEPPPTHLVIQEAGLRFLVDVVKGHKTGFYLDQRENRLLARRIAAGRRMLNCFSYTGGFTVAAAAGGAEETLSVESNVDAVDLAARNLKLNGFARRQGQHTLIVGDVFEELRRLRDRGEHFDFIVLDPPKFARHAGQVDSAARGYKDINWLAFRLLAPGGLLMTFSCSGAISSDLFWKIVFGAALDAGVRVRVMRWLHQAPDHTISLHFPEGVYLKGLLCRVEETAF
ncbi:MAG: class I SAM-dependent methyltransferase [Ardenticatenia bacterium]|nr:class I SAM-dependent methyltransferase [Ardenticatenia bacterium]